MALQEIFIVAYLAVATTVALLVKIHQIDRAKLTHRPHPRSTPYLVGLIWLPIILVVTFSLAGDVLADCGAYCWRKSHLPIQKFSNSAAKIIDWPLETLARKITR